MMEGGRNKIEFDVLKAEIAKLSPDAIATALKDFIEPLKVFIEPLIDFIGKFGQCLIAIADGRWLKSMIERTAYDQLDENLSQEERTNITDDLLIFQSAMDDIIQSKKNKMFLSPSVRHLASVCRRLNQRKRLQHFAQLQRRHSGKRMAPYAAFNSLSLRKQRGIHEPKSSQKSASARDL